MSNAITAAKQNLAFGIDLNADDLVQNKKWYDASMDFYREQQRAEQELASKSGWTKFIRTAVFIVAAIAAPYIGIPALMVGGVNIAAGTFAAVSAGLASWGVDAAMGEVMFPGGPKRSEFESKYRHHEYQKQFQDLQTGYEDAERTVALAEHDIDMSHSLGSLELALKYFGTKALTNI